MLGHARQSDIQIRAEADVAGFQSGLGPFVVAAEKTRMAMAFTNARQPTNPIVFANASFLALTGFTREDVLGKGLKFLLRHKAEPEVLAEIDRAFEDYAEREIHIRRNGGGDLCISMFVSPVVNKAGELVQHFLSFADLTKLKQKQTQLEAMIDELNHRVKNTLATVQSIVWQAVRKSRDPNDIREAIESRLLALSRSHNLLTGTHWTGASLDELIRGILKPFGLDEGRSGRITVAGGDVFLSAKATLALSLTLNELATNAAKYGALSNGTGSVAIGWKIETHALGDRLILTWVEQDGPSVAAPLRKGFGSRIIERGLAYELGGSADLQYRAEGLICIVNIPAPRNG